jgi:hypothetical protein
MYENEQKEWHPATKPFDLFKGLKKIVSLDILVNSPTLRVRESFFDYVYLREFEAKIGTAQNLVQWTFAEQVYAKTPENPPHCHVPLVINITLIS